MKLKAVRARPLHAVFINSVHTKSSLSLHKNSVHTKPLWRLHKKNLCTCVQNQCEVFIKTLHVHIPIVKSSQKQCTCAQNHYEAFIKTMYTYSKHCIRSSSWKQCPCIQNRYEVFTRKQCTHKTFMKSSWSWPRRCSFSVATSCWVSVGTAQRQQGNSLTPLSLCTGKGEGCRVS